MRRAPLYRLIRRDSCGMEMLPESTLVSPPPLPVRHHGDVDLHLRPGEIVITDSSGGEIRRLTNLSEGTVGGPKYSRTASPATQTLLEDCRVPPYADRGH